MIDYGSAQASGPSLTPEKLQRISTLCREERRLAAQVVAAEDALKKAKENYAKLTEDVLPAILQDSGVKEIKLDDGWSVTVKPDIRAHIKEEDRDAAHKWLRENGFGSLIKNTIAVTFGMGEDKKAAALYKELTKQFKGKTAVKEAVHSSTLRSFVTEVIEGRVTLGTGKKAKKLTNLPPTIAYTSLPFANVKEPKAHEKQNRSADPF